MVELEKSPDGDEEEAVREPDCGAVGCVLFSAGEVVGERP